MSKRELIGIWTPWGEALCSECHGPEHKRTGAPMRFERHETDGPGYCTRCGAKMWVHSEIALLTSIRHAMGMGEMQQTGGMCSALVFRTASDQDVVVTAEESILVGVYPDFASDGECLRCYSVPRKSLRSVCKAIQAIVDGSPVTAGTTLIMQNGELA